MTDAPLPMDSHPLAAARHEVAVVRRGVPSPAETRREAAVLRHLLARWVRVDVIWPAPLLEHAHLAAYAEWQRRGGAEVRTLPATPAAFAVADASAVVLAGGRVYRCPQAAGALRYLFHGLWRDAEPVAADRPAAGPGHLVLPLLAEGLTDRQIARRLGVSERAVGRTVAGLMGELRARSRFEAGSLAARRGWLRGR